MDHAAVNVVIDVIRAFTVAHFAFIKGAGSILLAGSVEEAFQMKEKDRELLLAGEVMGLPIENFDLDNSPYRICHADIAGKVLVQKTTNGVKAALHSLDAEEVLVTGFSNARTTARYIKKVLKPGSSHKIHLIASHPTGDDDLACAEFMKRLLEGHDPLAEETSERIRNSQAAAKFFDESRPEFIPEDIHVCAREHPSGFVMKINAANLIPRIERLEV